MSLCWFMSIVPANCKWNKTAMFRSKVSGRNKCTWNSLTFSLPTWFVSLGVEIFMDINQRKAITWKHRIYGSQWVTFDPCDWNGTHNMLVKCAIIIIAQKQCRNVFKGVLTASLRRLSASLSLIRSIFCFCICLACSCSLSCLACSNASSSSFSL